MQERLPEEPYVTDAGHAPHASPMLFNLFYSELLVGRLSWTGRLWEFEYSESYMSQPNPRPLPDLSPVGRVHRAGRLWPFFSRRIPDLAERDVANTVIRERIDCTDEATLLARFGLRVAGDAYLLLTEAEVAERLTGLEPSAAGGMPSPSRRDREKTEGHWLARENVEVEILAFIAMKPGRHGLFPSAEELRRHGRHRLVWAIVDFGGPASFLESLSLTFDPADRSWDGLPAGRGRELAAAITSPGPNPPVARAARALAALSEYLRLGGECPTTSEIRAAGCGWIESAARRGHTSLQRLAASTGLKTARLNNPKMYLADPENLRREIKKLVHEHGLTPNILPSQGTLRELGREDIEHAILKHHGGHVRAQQILGMRGPDDDLPDGHWNDLGNVRAGVLDFLRAKEQAERVDKKRVSKDVDKSVVEYAEKMVRNSWSQPTPQKWRMPSQRELQRAGLRGLDHAVRKHGGYAAVARKLGMLPPAARRAAVSPQARRGAAADPSALSDIRALGRELRAVARLLGRPDEMPTREALLGLGRNDLVTAVEDRHRGYWAVAGRVGLSFKSGRAAAGITSEEDR